jgi:hypothetical protein
LVLGETMEEESALLDQEWTDAFRSKIVLDA